MEIVLDIPSQKDTGFMPRQAVLLAAYDNGSLLLDERDFRKPARFWLNASSVFPWAAFLRKVFVAWQISAVKTLPKEFRPLQRIPPDILHLLSYDIPESSLLEIIRELRRRSFLPPLTPKPF
ncbi:MAG: hypothetical protein LBR60_02535 [Fibrobacter sp.]|jgi:hypothetical protein|nr:hypothetical protein [Fibrobacter sp.]